MNDKPPCPLSVGQEAANMAVEMLRATCQRIEIAGSVRRQRPQVHDVDLVIWPIVEVVETPQQLSLFVVEHRKIYAATALLQQARRLGWDEWPADTWPGIIRIPTSAEFGLAVERIPIELYVCEPDGSNFEALLQMRTGSAEYNIRLAQRAIHLGLRYKAGYGVFAGSQRMDDGTEAGIWAALEWEYVPPEGRS